MIPVTKVLQMSLRIGMRFFFMHTGRVASFVVAGAASFFSLCTRGCDHIGGYRSSFVFFFMHTGATRRCKQGRFLSLYSIDLDGHRIQEKAVFLQYMCENSIIRR